MRLLNYWLRHCTESFKVILEQLPIVCKKHCSCIPLWWALMEAAEAAWSFSAVVSVNVQGWTWQKPGRKPIISNTGGKLERKLRKSDVYLWFYVLDWKLQPLIFMLTATTVGRWIVAWGRVINFTGRVCSQAITLHIILFCVDSIKAFSVLISVIICIK